MRDCALNNPHYKKMYLRKAEYNDLPLMMAWRSNPLVYKGFYTQTKPLEWEEHINYWNSRNQDWHLFIVMYEERPIGIVGIGQTDHWSPEIGYTIGEVSLWGKGLGRKAVNLGIEWLRNHSRTNKHIVAFHTTIPKDNKRGLRLAKSLGLKISGDARKGEYWLTGKL